MSKKEFNAAHLAVKTVLKDLVDVQSIVSVSLFDTSIYKQVEELIESTNSIVSQADRGILQFKKVTIITDSIKKLSQQILETKAKNPLLSDQLVASITKTVTDANTALDLTNKALE